MLRRQTSFNSTLRDGLPLLPGVLCWESVSSCIGTRLVLSLSSKSDPLPESLSELLPDSEELPDLLFPESDSEPESLRKVQNLLQIKVAK